MNSSITYREIVYFVIDELKLISDDSTFTPEHIIFLADKMRAKLLYERYKDKLPVFFVEDIYKEKYVDLEQNNNPDGE